MKKLYGIVLAAVAAAGLIVAQDHGKSEAANVAGKWDLSLESPHGTIKGSLDMKQDGATLSGTCDLGHFGSAPLSGQVDGKKVAFGIDLHGMKVTFKGNADGSKISGEAEPFGGAWTASRSGEQSGQ